MSDDDEPRSVRWSVPAEVVPSQKSGGIWIEQGSFLHGDVVVMTVGGRRVEMHRNEDGSYSGQVYAGEIVDGTAFSTAGTLTIIPEAFS